MADACIDFRYSVDNSSRKLRYNCGAIVQPSFAAKTSISRGPSYRADSTNSFDVLFNNSISSGHMQIIPRSVSGP